MVLLALRSQTLHIKVRTLFYFYFLDNINNFIVYSINSWYLSPRKTLLEEITNFFARRWQFIGDFQEQPPPSKPQLFNEKNE